MSNNKKIVQKLKVGKDFRNDTTGIIYTIKSPDDDADDDSVQDVELFPAQPDPVRARFKKTRKRAKSLSPERPKTPETLINPSVSTRMELSKPACMRSDTRLDGDPLVKYVPPKPKGSRKAAKERRKEEEENRMVCDYTVVRVPSPTNLVNLKEFEMISPDVSKATVMPMKPSATSADLYPDPPTKDQLALHKPHSGIIIHPKKEQQPDSSDDSTDSEVSFPKLDQVDAQTAASDRLSTIEDVSEEEEAEAWENEDFEGAPPLALNKYTAVDEDQPLRMIRKQVSQTSRTTSLNEKDLMYEDLNWDQIPAICKLVQTFRDEQENVLEGGKKKKKKKIKKGTLESHSYTKIKQKTKEEFCYKMLIGTIHQGDDNFSALSRNRQGVCMSIAAFCYSKLKKPDKWNEKTVDDIVEIGDKLYSDSIGILHIHKERKQLTVKEVQKVCVINTKKVKYEVDEPDINGHVRSCDKRIYNITKGLTIFFHRHKSALFQASTLSLAIWKHKKYFYIYDANPRRKDTYEDPDGKASLICVQNIKSIVSILLDRSSLANSPFLLSKIKVLKVMDAEDPDDDVVDTSSMYNIINDKKAVVQGTFDLGDKCFMFTRNKQALTMSTVALVYSRITSPSTWRKKTVDKIMIIGNQLYAEIVKYENVIDIGLENLPALFTIGPYIVEIYIYANCHADTMYKKGQCAFAEVLELFFEKNNNAIIQIGKNTIGIWHQRNMYYCFDPYSRNNEGLKCRNGSACVTMNADIETLIDTVVANFDEPDVIFYVHALKVVKIHRDPAMGRLFPKSQTLNEVPVENFRKAKMRKSKKKALEKPIKTNFTEYAMMKLLAGDSPGASLTDIGSNIGSLNQAYLPPFMTKMPAKELIKTKLNEMTDVADLDSPALSETQIAPARPTPLKNEEEITLMDLDSFDLTQEEVEIQDDMEGEGEHHMEGEGVFMGGEGEDYEDQEGEEDYYLARSAYSQVNSSSLESAHRNISEEMNTDISYCYKILPTLEYPVKSKKDPGKELVVDVSLQELELKKETDFTDAQGDIQILQGTKNLAAFGENVDEMAPYACVMATAYAEEQSLFKWHKNTIDFVLKSGMELYQSFEVPYYRVEDFHMQFQKYEVDLNLETLLETYVDEKLFLSDTGEYALEALLENYVFTKSDCGFFFTKFYNCVIFFKRNLLYLFEPHGCDAAGIVADNKNQGQACLLRFKGIRPLAERILKNWAARLPETDDGCSDFVHIVLARPEIVVPGKKVKVSPPPSITDSSDSSEPDVSLCTELAKPNNFIKLPDGTQLIRGTGEIKDYGESYEAMAPYTCIMAAAVGAKYSVSTWSTDVVNYVLQCGEELYKKSKISFDEVAKLEIPKVSLGKTDFSLEVNYHFDATMKQGVVQNSLKKILKQHGDWAVIVTQEYACSMYFKNHLYYLFDCYATNEVGLSEGPDTSGYSSFSRFKDLYSMSTRIMYNKQKREVREKKEYTRFVLCTVSVKYLTREEKKKSRKKKGDQTDGEESETDEEDWMEQEGVVEESKKKKKKKSRGKKSDAEDEGEGEEEEKEKEPKNKVGFQYKDGYYVIEGTKSCGDSKTVSSVLKEDHFVCLSACLMVINRPIKKWDTKKVDYVIDQGKHIFSHANNVDVSDKRTIKNILICKHYFDVIVRPIKINNWRKNKNIDVGLTTIFGKRKFCLVQFPNCCLVVYKEENLFYLFSPYSWTYKNSDNKETTVQAGWVLYTNEKRLKKKVKSFMVKDGDGTYSFYSFEVISLRRAPKKAIISHNLQQYEVVKPAKSEVMGKPFHEQKTWLRVHQFPWSRMKDETASGKPRGKRESMWQNWDVEYTNDLYSLTGNLHQTSRKFKAENRGKQTLANFIVAIAMTNIYELSEWNDAILDSILANGDLYFSKCVEKIDEDNYEMAMDDLLEDCSIFPYTFKVAYTPAIEGTMFLTNVKKFNLYKALRYFFENYESRCGIIIAFKGKNKRLAAFGKIQENEYFMYDCQMMGPPMFFEKEGSSYILRCVTLARLLHVLILTLKGGDFYIYDVETYSFQPMS